MQTEFGVLEQNPLRFLANTNSKHESMNGGVKRLLPRGDHAQAVPVNTVHQINKCLCPQKAEIHRLHQSCKLS